MIRDFIIEENGAMTIEAAIITAALVALAIIFRKQLSDLWDSAGGEMAEMESKIEGS